MRSSRAPDEFENCRRSIVTAPFTMRMGGFNPLHIDPAVGEKAGFGGPILHGLCAAWIVDSVTRAHGDRVDQGDELPLARRFVGR